MEKWKENKIAYNKEYAKKNFKRIPLDVQKSEYDEIKAAADAAGETVNGYIKKAIRDRMALTKTDSTRDDVLGPMQL